MLAVLLLGAALRFAFIITPPMDSDMAIGGLMGVHFLHGDPSPVWWGQDYGGPHESMVAALFFGLLGVSRTTHALAPLTFSLLFLVMVYLVARDIFGRPAGLAAMGLAALGPFYLTWHSVLPRAIYVELLFLGAWLLWLTLRMLRRQPNSPAYNRLCLLWGLVAGLGLWDHLLMAYFLLPAFLVLWRHNPKPLGWGLPLMLLGGLAGLSPLIYYNFANDQATIHYLLKPKPQASWSEGLAFLGQDTAPLLLGLRYPKSPDLIMPWLAYPVLALSLGSLAWALLSWPRALLQRLRQGRQGDGSELLLLTLAAIILLFLAIGGAASGSHRYLLPVYVVWPLVLAFAWRRLVDRGGAWRLLGWASLALVAVYYGLGSLQSSPLLDRKQAEINAREVSDARAIAQFFKDHGVEDVYTYDYTLGPRLTFDVNESVRFVLPRGDRQPQYLDQLLRAPKIGLLVVNDSRHSHRAALRNLGATFKVAEVAGLQLFYDLSLPGQNYRLLSSQDFGGRGEPNPHLLAGTWDLNATTRWSTLRPQGPGQALLLDLGRPTERVAKVMLLPGKHEDLPRALLIEGSADGQAYQPLARTGKGALVLPWQICGGKPVLNEVPWLEINFPPQTLRWLRVSQLGQDPFWYWSVSEFLVGVEQETAPAQPELAAAWLQRELGQGVQVWCDPVLSAWLPAAMRPPRRAWQAPGWLREYLEPRMLLPLGREVHLAVEAYLAGATREVLDRCGWSHGERSAFGYVLFSAQPPSPPPPPAPERRRALAPDPSGQGLTIDLRDLPADARPRLVIEGSHQSPLSPRGLELGLSADGQAFQPADLRFSWPAELYWTGIMPLAARVYPLTIELPSQGGPFIRLQPQGQDLAGLRLELRY